MKRLATRAIVSVINLGISSLVLASCSVSGTTLPANPPSQAQESQRPETTTPAATPETTEPSPEPSKSTPVKPPTTKPKEPENSTDESPEIKDGQYITYAQYQISPDLYSGSQIVLFFNASWCSTCKVARENFESSLDKIPADLTLVVVDFDNSVELKKKYGVTYQHTFVHINDLGDSLHKWSGSVSFAEVVGQIT